MSFPARRQSLTFVVSWVQRRDTYQQAHFILQKEFPGHTCNNRCNITSVMIDSQQEQVYTEPLLFWYVLPCVPKGTGHTKTSALYAGH